METSNGSPNPPAGLLSLSTEILVMIAEELRYLYQRCNACSTVQAVWRTESNFVPMALTCRRFSNILQAYAFVPKRARGNCLLATFTCPCVLERMRRIAQGPPAVSIEEAARIEAKAEAEAEVTYALLRPLWKRQVRKARRGGLRGGSSSRGRGRG